MKRKTLVEHLRRQAAPHLAPYLLNPATEFHTSYDKMLARDFLPADSGYVLLHLGDATINCEILQWSSSNVTFRTPELGLRNLVDGELEVVRPDGRIIRSFEVTLAPRPALVIKTEIPNVPAVPSDDGDMPEKTAEAGGLTLEPANMEASERAAVSVLSGN
jgi:hypothetical protein